MSAFDWLRINKKHDFGLANRFARICLLPSKSLKGPLMSTHSACENIFTKQLIVLLLILSGDVEQNPGPEKKKSHLTFFHWDINGLMAKNFIKVSLLKL